MSATAVTGVLQTVTELGRHKAIDNRIHAAVNIRQQANDDLSTSTQNNRQQDG